MTERKRLSLMRRNLEEQLADDAHHIAEWGIEQFAAYAGIPIDQIDDDENIDDEPQEGWIVERDWQEERRTAERAERQQQRTEYTLARADLGGAHRIAAALARNGGKA